MLTRSPFVQHFSYERDIPTNAQSSDAINVVEDDWFNSSPGDNNNNLGSLSPFRDTDDFLDFSDPRPQADNSRQVMASAFTLASLSDDLDGQLRTIVKELEISDMEATTWVILLERFGYTDSDSLKLAAYAAKESLSLNRVHFDRMLVNDNLTHKFADWKVGKDLNVPLAQLNCRLDEVSARFAGLRDSIPCVSGDDLAWMNFDFPFEEVLKDQESSFVAVAPVSSTSSTTSINGNGEQNFEFADLDDLVSQSIEPGVSKRSKRQKVDRSKAIRNLSSTEVQENDALEMHGAASTVCSNSSVHGSNRKVSAIVGIDHDSKKPYFCKICFKAYSHHSSVYKHHQSSHAERKFQCETCGKTYTSRQNLSMHLKTKCNDRIRELEAENRFLRDSLQGTSGPAPSKVGKFHLKL
mmetsp:Transcript_24599/g.27996  ORF Transcript_24599/g.27996 Transcript_24599/m.27996 type:complete len:410 (+) Transcript_24599:1305-2534(+)